MNSLAFEIPDKEQSSRAPRRRPVHRSVFLELAHRGRLMKFDGRIVGQEPGDIMLVSVFDGDGPGDCPIGPCPVNIHRVENGRVCQSRGRITASKDQGCGFQLLTVIRTESH